MGFNSKGEKESEIRFSDEILKGRSFSDFEVSELFDNMYYILLDGNLLLIDNNKEPQSVVFEQKAGEKFVSIKNDNFFIPYQKSDGKGSIHNGLYKYSNSQSELVDFKPEIEFSGENFVVQNDTIYFVEEGNILHKVSVKNDNVSSQHKLSGLPNERTWLLGLQNGKLFVKQVSDKKRDIIYVLNGNDYLSEKQYELNFDYKDINKELRENEDLTLENPSRVFNFNYKNKIYFLRITNDGIAKIYFFK